MNNRSTFWVDGYRDGYDAASWSGPCFSVFAQEYTAGYKAGEQDRAESDRLEFLQSRDLL